MPLLPPRVRGPVSECSTFIRVQSQLAGADVEVLDQTSGVVIAALATAPGGDAWIPVVGPIAAGMELAARQRLGMEDSDPSAETVQVQASPNPMTPVNFATPVFRCGECVWIDGAVPGADVTVTQGGAVIGTGRSVDGTARVGLTSPIAPLGAVEAYQEACGKLGPSSQGTGPLRPDQAGQDRRLAPPSVAAPLLECSQQVTVSGVVPGATVELERSAGPNVLACFDQPSLYFGVNPALAVGETVRAIQRMPSCEMVSDWSEPVVVDELEPVPVPSLSAPLCAGGTAVTVCGLLGGALVKVTIAPGHLHGGFPVGGETYLATAPESGCFTFALANGLPADSVVYATQELCGRTSDPSNFVHVDPAPASLPTPRIDRPLFECATVVHVFDLAASGRVYVVSRTLGVVGEAPIIAGEQDVAVAPMLIADDEIFAFVIGCGLRSGDSEPVPVEHFSDPRPPRVDDPVFTCETAVGVGDVVPGARVDVFVNGVWRGSAATGTTHADVGVSGRLHAGDRVTATQALCGRPSRESRPVIVTVFAGRWFRVGGDDHSQILAVHAALTPSGRIVIFAGDQYDGANRKPNAPNVDHTRLMDTRPPYAVTSVTGLPPDANLFCSGHAWLEDGSLLVAGGTERGPNSAFHGDHWFGPRESWRFAGSSSWSATEKLNMARPADRRSGYAAENTGGRWYPTLVTLADGRVLALGGHPLEGDRRHTNTSLELFDPASNRWSLVGGADYANIPGAAEVPERSQHSEYPRCHVLRDGTVYVVSNMADGNTYRWTPGNDPSAWTAVTPPPPGYTGNPQPYTTVLLPLRWSAEYQPEILLFGRDTPYTIKPLTDPTFRMTNARAVSGVRIYPLATLLPTGEVFVSGGTRTAQDATGVLEGELYRPGARSWTALPAASRVRNYHSTALLMPNGAVWHSGSNRDCEPGPEGRDRTVEVFEPWYFCEPRPVISGATSRVCAGDELTVETPNGRDITQVVLLRCGSFTHAWNPDQRLVEVPFERSRTNSRILRARLPANAAVLVPGWYLLFVLDGAGVPSEGRMVQVCRPPASTPLAPPVGLQQAAHEMMRAIADFGRLLNQSGVDPCCEAAPHGDAGGAGQKGGAGLPVAVGAPGGGPVVVEPTPVGAPPVDHQPGGGAVGHDHGGHRH